MFLKKLFKYFIKFIIWLSGTIIVLIAAFSIVFALKIYHGPVPLNFIKPYIHHLTSQDEGTVKFQEAVLNWDKEQARFVLRLEGVELRENKTDHTIAKLGEVDVKLRLSALLKGKFVPSVISIANIHLHLFKERDGSLTLLSDPSTEKDPTETAFDLRNLILDYGEFSLLKPLKEVRIVESSVQITDRATGKDWIIPKVEFVLTRNLQDVDLEARLDLKVALATLQAKAKLVKTLKGISAISFESHAKLEKLQFNELAGLWPAYLAPLPREWVLANLSNGYVPKAEAALKSTLNFEGSSPKFTLENFNATVNFENMKVNYFEGLPQVTKVTGVAQFDKKKAVIKGSSGILKNLKIKKFDILITGLDVEDQNIAIDLDVAGPIIDALQILEAPPLRLTRGFAVQPNNVKGSATTVLHFDFPLETKLNLEQVNVRATSKLTDLEINDLLAKKELLINLTEGDLALKMDKSHMITTGKAKINGVPIDLSWHEKFKQQKDWTSQYLIKAALEGQSLISLGVPKIFTGTARLNLEYTQKNLKTSLLKANADFTSATPAKPGFQFLKPLGKKCEGQFLIEFENGKIRHVRNLKIQAPHLDVQLIARVKKDGTGLRMLESSRLQFGKSNFNVRLQKASSGGYAVSLYGSILDLEPFMTNLTDDKDSLDNLGLELSIDLQQIRLGENRALHQCQGKAIFGQAQWRRFAFNSVIKGKKKGTEDYLIVDQAYDGKQGNFLLKSTNAGEILRLLDVSNFTKGGILLIRATKQVKGPWIGKAVIDKGFSISNAPVATRILAAASGFGFFDAVSGQTISFEKLRTNFKLDKNQILLQDGRASGTSLGFTIAGLIDYKLKTLKLYGTVLPYNLFNMMLVKIPLIGSLLGGKGGGIFGVSYSVTGSFNKPKTSVNPFSALTPGFLRKIFDPTEYEDFIDDTDEGEETTDTDEANK